ncbi:MAG: DUF3823 domain-containing protein [Pedobacter sp.]|nr:MAG: DUF3823 domain-containing protein [Pedobacter sp.]
MKNNILISAISIFSIAIIGLFGCSKELDNKKYPSSKISGRFVYNGQQLQLMGTSSDGNGSNTLQLHQTGPGTWDPGFIKMFSREDGTFTINAYDGDYYLNITPGRGPWVSSTDTIRFNLQGEKSDLVFNVRPYYWLSAYSNTYTDSVLTANFKMDKVVSTANLEKLVIYLGTTSILDITSRVVERSFTNIAPGTVKLTLDLKTLSKTEKDNLKTTGFLFARIGVKTQGVGDLLYTKTVQLSPQKN